MTDVTALGVDVSNHNGNFGWPVWEGHIEFAFMKATEGVTYQDTQFARNWQESKAIGCHRFAYHYFHPNIDPSSQARYFYDFVAQQGIEPGDGFAMDYEVADNETPVNGSFAALVFLQELARLVPGHKLIVYTYPTFAQAGYCAKLGSYPLWIANYGVPTPEIPPPWQNYSFWQHVGSPLGQDIFNGTIAQLDTFAGTGTVITEPGTGLPVHANGSRTLQYVPGKPMPTGTDVFFLQRFLMPLTEPESWADGIYGPSTAERVSWYEGIRGIGQEKPYGIAGPQVWEEILHD